MKGVRFFRTIQVKLIIIYVLLILFAMQLIGVYFMQVMESSSLKSFANSLEYEASLLATFAAEKLPEGGRVDTDSPQTDIQQAYDDLKDIAKFSSADILQIVDAEGNVVSTTEQDAASVLGHKNSEILVSRALQNIKDNEQTLVDDLGNRIMKLAMPVVKDGKVLGAVYIEKSMKETYATIRRINGIFLSGTLIALALTALLGIFLSHTITSPIKEITRQVTSVAEGRFLERVRIHGEDEIGQLGKAFNHMTERLREALSLNEEEKEKLASILSNMNDGVLATDELGKIILINHRAAKMLDTSFLVAEGEPVSRFLGLPAELYDGPARDEESHTLLELLHPDREPRQVHVTLTPIHRREIGTTGTIIVLQDVTEQVELEQARREFVANVSHELRTPLTTMKSYLEALEDGALDEPELAKRFVGVTRNETERMIRLVTDLLHLSKFDSKQAHIKKEWTAIPEMLEEVSDRFAFQFKQKEISITLATENTKQALIDRDKIDQVLDNLMSNAVKYTPEKGSITIATRDLDGKFLEISIEDNGIGIPKRDLVHIFERFYRVEKGRSRSMGGTGLGLAIAREIVQAHGGAIELESEYNQGTRISFTLPYGEGGQTA